MTLNTVAVAVHVYSESAAAPAGTASLSEWSLSLRLGARPDRPSRSVGLRVTEARPNYAQPGPPGPGPLARLTQAREAFRVSGQSLSHGASKWLQAEF